MKSKLFSLLLTACLSGLLTAQNHSDSLQIMQSIAQLDQSLLDKDTLTLQKLLHSNLTLGHSNAWIETKESLIRNLPTQQVTYQSFTSVSPIEMKAIQTNVVWTRRDVWVQGTYQGKSFDMKLRILEIWTQENQAWQLVARQSVELEE